MENKKIVYKIFIEQNKSSLILQQGKSNPKQIILIGNYLPDQQESMIRFTRMLEKGFRQNNIDTIVWWPVVLFGTGRKNTNHGIGKWLGYIDKWLLFPLVIRWRLLNKKLSDSSTSFHICDHSNAPYLAYLPVNHTAITCHDVLAIRGSRGDATAHAPASRFGKILQNKIFFHLSRAKKLAAVSATTLEQLIELAGTTSEKRDWRVIYNSFNADFSPGQQDNKFRLPEAPGVNSNLPYILHVGAGHERKNRKMLISMLSEAGNKWNGNICYAGEAPDQELLEYARTKGIEKRIIPVIQPDHAVLVSLYRHCFAFVFPSFSEGFGWPLIEAQACGVPVICSHLQPMPEITGGASLLADPHKPAEFASRLLELSNQETRVTLIQKGFENVKRFETERIISDYLKLHEFIPLNI